jgi:hypothetical protein
MNFAPRQLLFDETDAARQAEGTRFAPISQGTMTMSMTTLRCAALVALLYAASEARPVLGQTKDTPAGEAKIRALLKERLAALKQIVEEIEKSHKAGGGISLDDVLQARLACYHAELDLCETDKERIAVLEKMLALAKESERMISARFDLGSVPHTAVLAARVNRLEAEIALERVKTKAGGQAK